MTLMDDDVDFAHTAEAERRRTEKATAIAKHLYSRGFAVGEVAAFGDPDRRRIEKDAGAPRSSGETWARALGLLSRRYDWDARNSVTSPTRVATPEPQPEPAPAPEVAAAPAPVEPPVATDPTPTGVCTHVAGADSCGGTDNVHAFLPGPRCPAHTPAALTGHPEVTPDPTRTLAGLRKAAGIPEHVAPPTSTSAAIDRAAVSSGKRRSNGSNYRSARTERTGRRRAG